MVTTRYIGISDWNMIEFGSLEETKKPGTGLPNLNILTVFLYFVNLIHFKSARLFLKRLCVELSARKKLNELHGNLINLKWLVSRHSQTRIFFERRIWQWHIKTFQLWYQHLCYTAVQRSSFIYSAWKIKMRSNKINANILSKKFFLRQTNDPTTTISIRLEINQDVTFLIRSMHH